MSDQATISTVPAATVAAPITRTWRTEDWIAVVLGFLVIISVLVLFQFKLFDLRNVVPNFRWTTDSQITSLTPGWTAALDQIDRDAESRQQPNVLALTTNLRSALASGDRKAIDASAAKMASLGPRTVAGALATEIRGHAAATPERVFESGNLIKVLYVGLGFLVVSAIGVALIGWRVAPFLVGLPVIFALAWSARFLAGNGVFVNFGIEYVIFALLLGLLVSNTIGTPAWLKPAVQTEFFVKTGLVILGASLLFHEVLQAGALGITQALLVVFVVWYSCFWLARKLRVDDDFAAMLSTAVSICGVSAAIAACGAIQGDKKNLSYVTSLVLIVAVPMMIVMPWIAKATGMDDLVAGAWLGGTLDTSASVVAAGALISDAAMKTGVIVKFSQNALIGVAAFALAIWWSLRAGKETGERPSAGVIWERFPKFVIGFVAASAVFSFALSPELVAGTRGALGEIRTWWFAVAFVCIGLETRFIELATYEQGRPALAFLGAQGINVIWTLLLAWLLFGGVIVAQPIIN
ncbi:MAG TPA: putative sulfate exporter family transporter [Xanthobacteraceae bacterium]|nr:putative sulfate exporter family transporter [Xanthobacteraceae bacterium]